MTGIPLGIYPLDKQTGGIKEVDLISFLAKSGVGKTFLLCIIASNLIKAGYKTLFLTKEMSPHQILKRVDAIMSGVSYSRLKDGALTNDEESIYKDYLENIAPKYASKLSIELIINGVAECAAKIDAYKPDIVLIDGGYLMSEGKDPEDWKAVLSVFKAFKIIALNRKYPLLLLHSLLIKVILLMLQVLNSIVMECGQCYRMKYRGQLKRLKFKLLKFVMVNGHQNLQCNLILGK